ncbi:hypothetical protein VMCG_01772 [Cytospora schulzeri]|uniref:Bromo domain-containing protein n=1 Tax=Cytospora schulzeri TaxID=448051 RepID=A0A423X2X2_9PEZI|nr:hypothetical protein VMCG_01772 [Valsa malicola]
MQGLEDNMEDPSEQELMQKLQAMEDAVDKIEREYRPCQCPRDSGRHDPMSVDIQDVGLIDLSGTSQHLKELHSVLQKLAGVHNFTPFWANHYFREIKRKVKAPEHLDLTPELRNCKLVLDELMHLKYGAHNHWFLKPVDSVVLNLPTYHETILHPMDLSTMRVKLENGEYRAPTEFKDDFDLMIRNCKSFNCRGGTCYTAGEEIERLFERLWSRLEFQP